MNERLRELEKQAMETVKCGLNGTSTAEVFNRNKFAELIVRECAKQVKNLRVNDYGISGAEVIREHFGVE